MPDFLYELTRRPHFKGTSELPNLREAIYTMAYEYQWRVVKGSIA
jgi:hypothetical protein